MSGWIGGLAEQRHRVGAHEGDTTYLSIAFTWLLDKAANRAIIARGLGKRVVAGGPALFNKLMRHELEDFAEIHKVHPDALWRHNPDATIASRGCPGKGTEDKPDPCKHCIVPKMWGTKFTLLPDFPVRKMLCDDNLSALPADYQDFIIRRYRETGTPLLDANSGFEPVTFTPEVYARWKPLMDVAKAPWRFGYDEMGERDQALAVLRMLKDEPSRRKRPYVLIGNEPFEQCMTRFQECVAMGAEPYVQPYIKLTALEKRPWVQFDWTEQRLKDFQRWANGYAYKSMTLDEYDRHAKKQQPERYDPTQGLFLWSR
jgi:hypothetical protein